MSGAEVERAVRTTLAAAGPQSVEQLVRRHPDVSELAIVDAVATLSELGAVTFPPPLERSTVVALTNG